MVLSEATSSVVQAATVAVDNVLILAALSAEMIVGIRKTLFAACRAHGRCRNSLQERCRTDVNSQLGCRQVMRSNLLEAVTGGWSGGAGTLLPTLAALAMSGA
jgi:hypothetical protein